MARPLAVVRTPTNPPLSGGPLPGAASSRARKGLQVGWLGRGGRAREPSPTGHRAASARAAALNAADGVTSGSPTAKAISTRLREWLDPALLQWRHRRRVRSPPDVHRITQAPVPKRPPQAKSPATPRASRRRAFACPPPRTRRLPPQDRDRPMRRSSR